MRARVILAAASLALSLAGCGSKACKDGTLLLSVNFEGGTDAADMLGVNVAWSGQVKSTTIPHSGGNDTIEVDFVGGYPAGVSAVVTITALSSSGAFGTGSAPITLGANCEAVTIDVTPRGNDLAVGDASDAMNAMPAVLALGNQPAYDFGTVVAGVTSAPATLTVTNKGAGPSSAIMTAALSGTGASSFMITTDGCQGRVLAPNAACAIEVVLSATAAGTPTATLSVSATDGGMATLELKGTVVTCAAASASAVHYVDPNNGVDNPLNGGGTGTCAYKTIGYALAHATGAISLANTTYSSATESFPLTLTGTQDLDCNGATINGSSTAIAYFGASVPVTIRVAGTGNTINDCNVTQPSGTAGFVISIDTSATAPAFHTISNCNITAGTTSGGSKCIYVLGGLNGSTGDRVHISGCTINQSFFGIGWANTNQTGSVTNTAFIGPFGTSAWGVVCGGVDSNVTGSGNTGSVGTSYCTTCANCSAL